MSQRDLPLWARGLAAALLIIASWWLVETDTLRGAVGDSIALVSLGIVTVSILQGMHLPLGLWPEGPWRPRFSKSVVVAVAVAFGLCFVVFDPGSDALFENIDTGVFVLVVLGVVGWGFSWAFVRQRSFAPWYAIGIAVALVPLVGGLVGLALRTGEPAHLCLWAVREGTDGSVCGAPALRTFGFMTAVCAASSLVTLELTFRRLLIGEPGRAGLVLVVAAAIPYGLWILLVAPNMPGLDAPVWLGIIGAMVAGSLYALSRSLLVSALYSGAVFAGYEALVRAVPEGADGTIVLGWEFAALHALAAVALMAWVHQRRGMLTGLR